MIRNKILALMVGLALSGSAAAGTATLTWTQAATNTDNSLIPATGPGSLTKTTVEYGTCVGTTTKTFGTKAGEITVIPPVATAQVNMVVIQEYCFRASHTNTYNNVSAFSNVGVKNNPAPTPGAPSALTVAADLTAYDLQEGDNFVNLIPVGTMKASAMCDGSKEVLGKFLVNVNDVDSWYGSVRPRTVYASCS